MVKIEAWGNQDAVFQQNQRVFRGRIKAEEIEGVLEEVRRLPDTAYLVAVKGLFATWRFNSCLTCNRQREELSKLGDDKRLNTGVIRQFLIPVRWFLPSGATRSEKAWLGAWGLAEGLLKELFEQVLTSAKKEKG